MYYLDFNDPDNQEFVDDKWLLLNQFLANNDNQNNLKEIVH